MVEIGDKDHNGVDFYGDIFKETPSQKKAKKLKFTKIKKMAKNQGLCLLNGRIKFKSIAEAREFIEKNNLKDMMIFLTNKGVFL